MGYLNKNSLEPIFPEWFFITYNAKVRSGGPAIGLNLKYTKILGLGGSDMLLGDDNFSVELGKDIKEINIYVSCQDRPLF